MTWADQSNPFRDRDPVAAEAMRLAGIESLLPPVTPASHVEVSPEIKAATRHFTEVWAGYVQAGMPPREAMAATQVHIAIALQIGGKD